MAIQAQPVAVGVGGDDTTGATVALNAADVGAGDRRPTQLQRFAAATRGAVLAALGEGKAAGTAGAVA